MNATSILDLEDELGYEFPVDRLREPLSERVTLAMARKSSGRERVSQKSRFSRRAAPQCMSRSHRRGNKRYGL